MLKPIFAHVFGHSFAVIFLHPSNPPAVPPIRRGATSSTASPPCSNGASRSARSTLALTKSSLDPNGYINGGTQWDIMDIYIYIIGINLGYF